MDIPRHITKPARYIGIEPNRVMKATDRKTVRFALCYPDIYEVGMSYYGHFLIYETANRIDDVWCERCFAPWQDMETYLRKNGLPLCTLESKTPLGEMDLVGFSLTYELNITNVLGMLRLAGIPLRAQERTGLPVIMGGGPLTLNPGPLETFFDVLVMGEADDILIRILDIFKEMKGLPKHRIMEELNRCEGVYVPLLGKDKVKRLFVEDLDGSFHPVGPPIPVVGSIHNRLNIEISRGCGNGCRFCLAGFGYRPYRERSFATVTGIIDQALAKTGYEEISLLSLSSGDYSYLSPVVAYVKDRYRGVSVSLPSLKIGTLDEEDVKLIGSVARTGLTFALEAATVSLRRHLNKNIDTDVLIGQLAILKQYGWRKLKLYLMVGFPWETEDDLMAIRDVIAPFEREGIDINLSVAPLIPKPHTPFQWLPMEDETTLAGKMYLIKDVLRKRRVRVKYRDVKTSMVEGLIARGDTRLAGLFEYLLEQDVRLEAWREFFRPELYDEWFAGCGFGMEEYLRGRTPTEELPWDFVDNGVGRDFLAGELARADIGETTVDCYSGCAQCGMECANPRRNIEGYEVRCTEPVEADGAGQPGIRYTFRYGKYGDARYIGHIDTMNIMVRVLRSAGIPIKTRGKYRPMPKISLSDALPVGIESTCELLEFETLPGTLVHTNTVKELNERLPAGMKIYEFIKGEMRNLARDASYILVSEADAETDLWKIGNKNGRHYYIWKGKGIKDLFSKGIFQRIIKTEDRRIHGSRADH